MFYIDLRNHCAYHPQSAGYIKPIVKKSFHLESPTGKVTQSLIIGWIQTFKVWIDPKVSEELTRHPTQ